jgi:hypothetical protein
MREFLTDKSPGSSLALRNGLHYYKIHDFLDDIVRPDSLLTEWYRESYPQEVDKEENLNGLNTLRTNQGRLSSRLLRRVGRHVMLHR